jgi:hypothetical protein
MPPRGSSGPSGSAGQLHIGAVIYEHGVFSAEMVFVVNGLSIGEDAAKSAAQAASRHFFTLLHQNGFQNHGYPEVRVVKRELRSIMFRIEAPADRALPRVITIRDPEAYFKEAKKGPDDDS